MKLHLILKDLMKESSINATELSKATEVPLSTLHGWLNSVEPKSIKQVQKVAQHFNVPLDYLCFGSSPEYNPTISTLNQYSNEIELGNFEIVLRKIRKRK